MENLIGLKFKYLKSVNKSNKYDKVIAGFYKDHLDKTTGVISSNGINYRLDEIKIEPLSELRNKKLKKLGI